MGKKKLFIEVTDEESKRKLARKYRLNYKICRRCGARNSIHAVKCRKCRSYNLRLKHAVLGVKK